MTTSEELLYDTILGGAELSFVKIKTIFDFQSAEPVRQWNNGHPLLHEAAEQSDTFQGAVNVLCAAFVDRRLRPLFTDLTYTDKYGACPARRLWEVTPEQGSVGFRILKELTIENPSVPWLCEDTAFDYENQLYGRFEPPEKRREKLWRHLNLEGMSQNGTLLADKP